MTEKAQVYKCLVCGIVVEVLDGGLGEPVCCGQPMQWMREQADGPRAELHRPRIEACDEGIRVRIGGGDGHPMDARHFVQWIEAVSGSAVCRRELHPNDPPQAVFPIGGERPAIRAFCNIHGLWKGESE